MVFLELDVLRRVALATTERHPLCSKGHSVFDDFGKSDSRKMPAYLFSGSLHVYHLTAVKADISRQDFSVCPRHWYIDATFRCRRCGQEFLFSVDEQKFWYEECQFWIDSMPRECPACRQALRDLKALKQEYDRDVALASRRDMSTARKQRLIEVIDALVASGVGQSPKMASVRDTLIKQVERSQRSGAA
jgi:hypothetical protein